MRKVETMPEYDFCIYVYSADRVDVTTCMYCSIQRRNHVAFNVASMITGVNEKEVFEAG